MTIALRSIGTITFFKIKKGNTKNITKCFGGKMYSIIRNKKTIENKFYIV